MSFAPIRNCHTCARDCHRWQGAQPRIISTMASMNYDETVAAFAWPLQFCGFSVITTYIASLITGNVSQVDRLWTFLPVLYSAYFALLPVWPSQTLPLLPYVPSNLSDAAKSYSARALLIFGLEVVWMIRYVQLKLNPSLGIWHLPRLTYNTFRRGLFNPKEEDYRYGIMRAKLPPLIFQVFNFTAISVMQNALLLTLCYPTYVAAVVQPHTPLTMSDLLLGALALVILGLEFTSAEQG